MNQNLALITPAKNEQNNIQATIDSVSSQTFKPNLWIIVNDNSTDNTLSILESNQTDWIKIVTKQINPNYSWLGYSKVVIAGIEFLNQLIRKEEIKKPTYLGILDADIKLEKEYFEKLIGRMDQNQNIAAMSGAISSFKRGSWRLEATQKDRPRGGARIYRYVKLIEIGGFPNTPSPDTVSDIKLNNIGYQTQVDLSSRAFQQRPTLGREGKIKGLFLSGKGKYILGYNLIHIFLIAISLSLKQSPYIISGLAYFLGYINGLVKNDPQIKDEVVSNYSRNFWDRII